MVTKKTAPESLQTTTGALTRPTGAEQVPTGIMAPGRAFRKGARHAMRHLCSTC
jgi:hypothetical protein